MIGKGSDKAKEGDETSLLEREREKKFEITWAQCKAFKSRQDAEARAQEESTRSAVRETDVGVEARVIDDLDISWMGT